MRKTLLLAALLAPTLVHSAEPAAKPAAPKPAAKAEARDPGDPAALTGVISSLGGKVAQGKAPAGRLRFEVTTPGGGFGVVFIDCDPKGKACKAAVFSTAFERKAVSLNQLNAFNREQPVCRGVLGEDGRPNVIYSLLLTQHLVEDDLKQHIGVWQGCLSTFAEFTEDPAVFLVQTP